MENHRAIPKVFGGLGVGSGKLSHSCLRLWVQSSVKFLGHSSCPFARDLLGALTDTTKGSVYHFLDILLTPAAAPDQLLASLFWSLARGLHSVPPAVRLGVLRLAFLLCGTPQGA